MPSAKPIDPLSTHLPKNLMRQMAEAAFPKGGILKCRVCSHQQKYSLKEAEGYMTKGWPSHCREPMVNIPEKKKEE